MRTDFTRISDTAKAEAKQYITDKYGEVPLLNVKHQGNRVTGCAHEAIRPLDCYSLDDMKSFLTKDQYRLLQINWERFVASQMAQAILDTSLIRHDAR